MLPCADCADLEWMYSRPCAAAKAMLDLVPHFSGGRPEPRFPGSHVEILSE